MPPNQTVQHSSLLATKERTGIFGKSRDKAMHPVLLTLQIRLDSIIPPYMKTTASHLSKQAKCKMLLIVTYQFTLNGGALL
jgi:hypothetical protein